MDLHALLDHGPFDLATLRGLLDGGADPEARAGASAETALHVPCAGAARTRSRPCSRAGST